MKIEVQNISKKFGKTPVIKNFSGVFEPKTNHAIIGSNGKGKSTLLKMISGFLSPDSGNINYSIEGNSLEVESSYQYISFLASYITFQEELTLLETIDFMANFKEITTSSAEFFDEFELDKSKKIMDLSTGMKQRFFMGIAFRQNSNAILLDEPTSFLDSKWKSKFQNLVDQAKNDHLLILSSNDPFEYEHFNNTINLV